VREAEDTLIDLLVMPDRQVGQMRLLFG